MQFSFDAIGTHWIIDIDLEDKTFGEQLEQKILQRIAEFDKNYSRFRDDSLVAEISKATGVYHLPDDAEELLDFYRKLYTLTEGLFTPLIGQVMEQVGYDKNYSLTQADEITKPHSWNEALEYEFPTLTVKQPVVLDFGAAGKGYLIDIIGRLLRNEEVKTYTIDAGGDILHWSDNSPDNLIDKPLRIGLEDPNNTAQAIGVAELRNQSIAGSAGNRRKWGEFHHIINPDTLKPVNQIAALWVIADTAILADGLATALYLLPDPQKFSEFKFEYLIVFEDRTLKKSSNFPAEIFFA